MAAIIIGSEIEMAASASSAKSSEKKISASWHGYRAARNSSAHARCARSAGVANGISVK